MKCHTKSLAKIPFCNIIGLAFVSQLFFGLGSRLLRLSSYGVWLRGPFLTFIVCIPHHKQY